MNEEERIRELIFLRVYNKNANVYIKIGLEEFIQDIVHDLEKVQSILNKKKNSEKDLQFSKPLSEEVEDFD